MSELIHNPNERLDALAELSRGLIQGGKGRLLVEKHKAVIDTVTPAETMEVLDKLLNEGYPLEEVKAGVGKIINIFFKSLNSQEWSKPAKGHFLYYMMLENAEVKKLMNQVRTVTKRIFHGKNESIPDLSALMKLLLEKLKNYELHYIKKENILFPYIEQTFPQYRCLQIMWSFHDDFRQSLKKMDEILSSAIPDLDMLNKELGKLFFVVLPVIFREEQIVFPVALRVIPDNQWANMLTQSAEIGWCYIEQPQITIQPKVSQQIMTDQIDLETGILFPEQIKLMLDTLPVDVTFIDEHDEVRYFSGGKHRIFSRVNAIIGRKVQNCHPTDSVYLVNKIIKAFRDGEKDHADFWIQMGGKFIHIRYYAVRNQTGDYKGTLEVSQDVTEIRSLKGEQKLLDWKN